MDVSETDISPSAGFPSRDISMILDHCPQHLTSQAVEASQVIQRNVRQLAEPQTAQGAQQLMEQRLQNQVQYNTSSPMTITPTSPNGNSLTTSDLTFQDACSSPDQLLDDVMNSNERLDITGCCSDNENLERLGRKVIELINENRLSMQSTSTTSTTTATMAGNNHNQPSSNTTAIHHTITIENGNSECLAGRDTTDDACELRTPRLSRCSSLHRNSLRQQVGGAAGDMGNVLNANGESNEDLCDDSWSDEEGEDTDYNYSLRRRR